MYIRIDKKILECRGTRISYPFPKTFPVFGWQDIGGSQSGEDTKEGHLTLLNYVYLILRNAPIDTIRLCWLSIKLKILMELCYPLNLRIMTNYIYSYQYFKIILKDENKCIRF